jgi:PAS domain S-box-containing protein
MSRAARAAHRLQKLYEIGNLLARFDGAAQTVPKIIAAVRETLPLRTAILVVSLHPPILIVIRGEQVEDEAVRAATRRARAACAYLAGTGGEGEAAVPGASRGERKANVISLPLVVRGHPTFGAFHLEATGPLDEGDLAFANAVANHLALAIDRDRTHLTGDDRPEVAAGALPDRHEVMVQGLPGVFTWEVERDAAPPWIDRVPPDDRLGLLQTLEEVTGAERAGAFVHRLVTPAGEVRWFNSAAHRVDLGAAAPRLAGISVDITELKRTEEEALRQLEFVKALTSSLAEGIVAVDRRGRITFINPTAEELLDCEGEPVVGEPVSDLLRLRHADGTPFDESEEPLARAIFTGEPCRGDDSSLRRRDGSAFPVSYSAAPLSYGGEVAGAVLVFQDLVDLLRAERHQRFLAEASAVLSASLDYRETLQAVAELAVPLLADICTFDELDEGGTVERLVVVGSEELRRRLADLSLPSIPRPDWKSPQALAMESGDPTVIGTLTGSPDDDHSSAVELMRAAGLTSMVVFPMLARGRTLGALTLALSGEERKYEGGDLRVAEDLAHRAAIAIDNARLARAAQDAVRLRQDLLSIVSHDLRNPLSVILLNLHLLLERPDLDARMRSSLGTMRRSAKRIQAMVRDLLDTANIEAHGLSVVPAPIEVAPLIAEAMEAVSAQAANRVTLAHELAPGLPRVLADGARIQQVLVNLAANAIRFTAAGGKVTFRAEVDDGLVKFSVEDTGTGIAAADLGHLFERFYQAASSSSQGTGIVEAHGGTVWVESQVGRGSTFFFTVPIAPDEPAQA